MARPEYPTRRAGIETYVIPDGTAVVLDPATGAAYALDLVRSLLWELCDGTLTRGQIASELAALLPQQDDAQAFALQMLDELDAWGLLEADGAGRDAP